MAMNKKEHTTKTPAKQGADEVIPKAIKSAHPRPLTSGERA
jgi:hypothetical protein